MVAAACGYTVRQEYDRVLDRRVTRMSRNVVGGINAFGVTVVINGMRVEQGGTVEYGLMLQTLSWSDWIHPSGLMMRVDGELVDFGEGSEMLSDVSCSSVGCQHDERYFFLVTEAMLRKLAGAESVIVRISGRGGYIERDFSPENIANFADFVSGHVGRR